MAGHFVSILQGLMGGTPATAHPGVVESDVEEWAEFVERHILKEYRPGSAPWQRAQREPPPPRAPHMGRNRTPQGHNRVRRTPELIRRLRTRPGPASDNRGHRLHRVGDVVQTIYDLHGEGFCTLPCIQLLRLCVLDRRFAEYEHDAAGYLREAVSGSSDS